MANRSKRRVKARRVMPRMVEGLPMDATPRFLEDDKLTIRKLFCRVVVNF